MSSNNEITENTDLRVEAVMKKLIEGIVTDKHPSSFLFVLDKVGSKAEELSGKTFGTEVRIFLFSDEQNLVLMG